MVKLINIFIENKLPLLTFTVIIFLSGIIFGSVAVKTVDYSTKQDLFNYFNDFLQGVNKIDYDQSSFMGETIKFNLFNMLVLWIFGISVVIMPMIPVLIFFKGFVLGFTVGFLVSEFEIKGIVIALLTIFPQNILIIPVYIFAGITGVAFSLKIIRYYRRQERMEFNDFFDYSLRFGLLTLFLLAGTMLETYLSPFLLKLIINYI